MNSMTIFYQTFQCYYFTVSLQIGVDILQLCNNRDKKRNNPNSIMEIRVITNVILRLISEHSINLENSTNKTNFFYLDRNSSFSALAINPANSARLSGRSGWNDPSG